MKQKHFIHADVQRLGLKCVNKLVNQSKDDFIRLRIHGIPLAAINSFVIGEGARSQIELRILREQRASIL